MGQTEEWKDELVPLDVEGGSSSVNMVAGFGNSIENGNDGKGLSKRTVGMIGIRVHTVEQPAWK